MYKKTTNSIQVSVSPMFQEDASDPVENFFVWTCFVEIENKGRDTVQLKQRNWIVTDLNGLVIHPKGEGAVSDQPMLRTGESFNYISGVPLSSPSGIIHGSYVVLNQAGKIFEVAIPTFSLDSPYDYSSVH